MLHVSKALKFLLVQIRSALQDHFGACGDINRVSIPKDYETGNVKGFVFVWCIFYPKKCYQKKCYHFGLLS